MSDTMKRLIEGPYTKILPFLAGFPKFGFLNKSCHLLKKSCPFLNKILPFLSKILPLAKKILPS